MRVTAAGRFLLLLGDLGDQRFGRQQQRRDRRGVLQRAANDLRRIDDAGLDQILVDLGRGVEALVGVLLFLDLRDDDRAFLARRSCAIQRIGSSIARLMICRPTA